MPPPPPMRGVALGRRIPPAPKRKVTVSGARAARLPPPGSSPDPGVGAPPPTWRDTNPGSGSPAASRRPMGRPSGRGSRAARPVPPGSACVSPSGSPGKETSGRARDSRRGPAMPPPGASSGGYFPGPPACPSRARPGAASTLGTPLPGERGAPSARRAGLRARALVLPCARRSQEPPPACAGPERADWGAVTCERQPVFSTRAARRSPGATAPSGRDAVAYPNPQSPWQALASDPVPSLARARQPRSRAPSVACGAVLAGERPPRIRMCVAPATRSQRGRWRRRLGPWLFTSRGVPTTPATGELTSAHQTKAPPEPARSPGRYGKSRPVSPRRAPS